MNKWVRRILKTLGYGTLVGSILFLYVLVGDLRIVTSHLVSQTNSNTNALVATGLLIPASVYDKTMEDLKEMNPDMEIDE